MSDRLERIAGLSPEKQALLLRRLKGKGDGARPQIKPRGRAADSFPLSFAQQRLWFLNQLQPDSPFYNVSDAYRLTGRLNVGVLERSFHALVRRHETLRTTFITVGGEPRQFINEAAPFTLPVIDLTSIPAKRRKAEALRLAVEEAERLFDLRRDLMLRVSFLRMDEEEHVLLISTHHIASDGWSRGVLVGELMTLYEAFVEGRTLALPELPIQYADYAVWQREQLTGAVLDEQLGYWKERLGGELPVLELPTDRPRPPLPTYLGAYYLLEFSENLSAELNALSRRAGATLYMTLLAAFNVLLYRYTGQTDIVVGTPTAGRNRREVEGLIGFFVNTLVMRTDLSGDPTFRELLGRVREVALGAQTNQDVPFEKLVEELHPQRDMSRNPLFQVAFGLQNAPTPDFTLPGLTLTPMDVGGDSSKFDLEFHLWESGGALDGAVIYSTDLFEETSIARLFTHYVRLLEGVVAAPDTRISDLPLLTEDERQQMLVGWNQTATPYPRRRCIHELFEAQAARTPERVALIFGEERVSYGELNRRANRLARYLRAAGVAPEVTVGVFAERSVEMVVGLLAVLKAGGAYLPLDPASPRERRLFMLEEAAVPVLLTQERLRPELHGHRARLFCLDSDWDEVAHESDENPGALVVPENLAYVMYTSGSTGRPKGVGIEHRSVVRLVKGSDYTGFTTEDVFLLLAPVSFDASTFEVWGSLLNGARLAVMPPHQPSLEEIGRALREYGVTTLWLTAGLFNLMVDERPEDLSTLRWLLTGGDAASVAHMKKFLRVAGECALVNGYGPTENTTFTTTHHVRRDAGMGSSVPIGRPIANTRAYVLDARLRPVPVGVTGEMYVGGDGLARGYLRQPGLTAERFVPDPFDTEGGGGGRLYKTGDLCRLNAGGQVEFLGRADHQVKIRGFRIELGEIEMALVAHPKVREAAVVARADAPGEKHLTAYVVQEPGAALTHGELRAFLSAKLPKSMLPSGFVPLDEMPLTANGKLDRRALQNLPEPEAVRQESWVAPRDALELQIAQIWEAVLKSEAVGVNDNFFDLGGHSLLATRVVNHLRERCGVEVSLRVMFESPTVEGMALHIKTLGREQEDMGRLAGMLDRLEQFSEEEVRALLEETRGERLARSPGDE